MYNNQLLSESVAVCKCQDAESQIANKGKARSSVSVCLNGSSEAGNQQGQPAVYKWVWMIVCEVFLCVFEELVELKALFKFMSLNWHFTVAALLYSISVS